MATDTDYAVLAAVEHLRAVLGRDPMVSEINRHLPQIKRGTIAKCVQRMSKDGRLERIENGARPRYRVPSGGGVRVAAGDITTVHAGLTPEQRAALERTRNPLGWGIEEPALRALAVAHEHGAHRAASTADTSEAARVLVELASQAAEQAKALHPRFGGWHLSAAALESLDMQAVTAIGEGRDAEAKALIAAVEAAAVALREALDKPRPEAPAAKLDFKV